MLARRLDFAPAAEEIPQVISVYVDDLSAHGLTDADAGRVRVAFETVGRKTGRWPRPVDVIGALPKREDQTPLLESQVPRYQRKANLAVIREMLKGKVVDLGK